MLLNGLSVIVSGVGPGLGQELARACLREGASVALACRNKEYLKTLCGELSCEFSPQRFIAVPTDITDKGQCQHLVSAAQEAFGGVDVLLNSAYDPGPYVSFEEADLSDWQGPLDVNLLGAMRLTQCSLPALKTSSKASIVNVNSMIIRKPLANQGAYIASKGALLAATKSLAVELAKYSIRANSVLMGWMWGDAVERSLQVAADARGTTLDAIKAEVATNIPLGEIPDDADCANAVVFLASPMARVITGASLDVNGGEFMP